MIHTNTQRQTEVMTIDKSAKQLCLKRKRLKLTVKRKRKKYAIILMVRNRTEIPEDSQRLQGTGGTE